MPHRSYYRRHLPHYLPAGGTFHVIFRLAGSLPHAVIQELQHQLLDLQHHQVAAATTAKPPSLEQQRRYFSQLEHVLDSAEHGPTWLRNTRVAELVHEALLYRDGHQYTLRASTIMPNHVHIVCTPRLNDGERYYQLPDILRGLKGYTARKANAILNRHGPFWHEESYDRVIRDITELGRTVGYVANNPVKAKLASTWEDWPWTYVAPEMTA